jgi:hypothetical protein
MDPQLIFIPGEAYLHLSGYVNCRNIRIWSDQNPQTVYRIPPHDVKIGVWCPEVLGESSAQYFTTKPITRTDTLGMYWNHFPNS